MGFRIDAKTESEWRARGIIVDARQFVAPIEERVSEKEFQAAVVSLAKRNGWRVYHTHDSRKSEAGFPDLVMVRAGRLIIAELKAASGKVAAAQQNWIDDLRSCGLDVRVWRPSDWKAIVEVLT